MTPGRPSSRALSVLLLAVFAAGCQLPGQAKSPGGYYQDGLAAVKGISAYRLAMSFDSSGSHHSYDLKFGGGGSLSGTIELQAITAEVVVAAGHTYIRGRAFIQQFGNPATAAAVGDRWVRTQSDPFSSMTSLGPADLARGIAGKQSLSDGGAQMVGGVAAEKIYDRSGAIFVAQTGKPYILRIQSASGVALSGNISNLVAEFSQYGTARADPPPADFVDAIQP